MSTHSLEETEAFLKRNGIPDDVIQNFQINSITLDMAPEINETYLRDLCPQIGTRIKLKKVLQIYIDSQADTSSCTSGGENNSILDHNISLNEINNVTVTLFRERAEFPDFDLKTLLMTSALGNSILNHYTSQGTLDGKRRSMLTDIVIRHLYTRIVNCRMTHEEYNFIAAKIVSLFPTETVGTYFVKPVRKQDSKRGKPLFAKGKLVDKVRNILYMSGERKRKISDEGESSQKSFTEDDLQKSVVSENHQAELLWLKTNINPWQEVQRLWHETYEDRRHMENASVHDFLKNFKILEDPRCEDLINYDFNRLYPNKSMCFYTNWETFFKTLMQLKEKELTEQCRLFIDMTATIDDEEKKLPLQMEIFGHLVPPKGRLNRKVKFSILESIEGLVVKVQTTGDIEKKICDLKEKANKKKQTIQPYIIVVGDYNDWTTLYIIVDTVKYQFTSAYKAFDLLFKLYHVFNVCYPPATEHLYLIIQRKIYDIVTEYDCIPPYIYEILSL